MQSLKGVRVLNKTERHTVTSSTQKETRQAKEPTLFLMSRGHCETTTKSPDCTKLRDLACVAPRRGEVGEDAVLNHEVQTVAQP